MNFSSFNGTRPITWWGRMPVYATTLLVIAHTLVMILIAVTAPLGGGNFFDRLTFSSIDILQSGEVWRVFTYPFVVMPSFWFLLTMLMLWWFGTEVEKFLGRQAYLTLYAILILTPSLVFIALGLAGYSSVFAGANALEFAIFISFVLIYPNAFLLFSLRAKWVALALFAISFLASLAVSDWTQLLLLCVECAVAVIVLRQLGVRSLQFNLPQKISRPKIPQKISQKKVARKRKKSGKDPLQEIDPILEKIAKSGLSSLSAKERGRLEEAREELLQKEKK
ncbi:MAG: rhomboid family intramembrane serine protease [Chthoniobacterales bacterium]